MKPALRTCKLFIILSIIIGCDQGKDEVLTSNSTLITGTDLEKEYDFDPQVAKTNDLALSAFISRRVPSGATDSVSKVYLFNTQSVLSQFTADIPQFSTARELNFALSPNGLLMAIFARTPQDTGEDVSSLSIISLDKENITQVSGVESDAWIDSLAFAPDSGALVYTKWADASPNSYYLPVNSETGAIGEEFKLEKKQNIEVSSTEGVDYVKVAEKGIYSDVISLHKESGTKLVPVEGTLDLAHSSLPSRLGPQGFLYFSPLAEATTKDRLGNFQQSEESSGRGKVFIEQKLMVGSLGDLRNEIAGSLGFEDEGFYSPLRPVKPHDLAAIEDYTLVAGGDYYVCEKGVLYGTTLTLINHSTKALLTFMIGTDDQRVPTGPNLDPCSTVVPAINSLQLFEQRIEAVSLKRAANGEFMIAFESWDRDDPEIYQFQFSADFTSTEQAKTSFTLKSFHAVSNNS